MEDKSTNMTLRCHQKMYIFIFLKSQTKIQQWRSKRKYERSKGMEKTRTFLTGSEPSKDCHSQRCPCSWDFMRDMFINLTETQNWAKGQRSLSTTEKKIRNYWKSCDHRFPLFPAADPDPWAHPETLSSFSWGRWEQRLSDAVPKSPQAAGQG